jgi:mannose-1-phosphate guanylyltransferase
MPHRLLSGPPVNGGPRPWTIVLAGGDGRRLQGTSVAGHRLDRPKQFCRIQDEESLLRATLRRAAHLSDAGRIVALVRDEHRRWWEAEVSGLPASGVLTEPANRGTGVAVLHALVHVLVHDADPTVALLPSDHAVDEEAVLLEAIRHALRRATAHREDVLILGVTADAPETEYGWILPAAGGRDDVHPVTRFVEKPDAGSAARLFAAGGLWNSFICVASGNALLGLFEHTQAELLRLYLQYFLLEWDGRPERTAEFEALPEVDFSRDVLTPATSSLSVLAIPPCGWTDLGTPPRLGRWVERPCPRSRVPALRDMVPGMSGALSMLLCA